jgi:hypothetical protein
MELCEIFQQGLPWKSSGIPQYVRAFGVPHLASIHKVSATAEIWPRIVGEYCERKFTLSKDKLVTVGGLAKFIQEPTGASYHAGLWAPGLEYQLCWYSEYPAAKSDIYRAPSWSWASIYGSSVSASDYNQLVSGLHCEVLGVHVDNVTPDNPFGKVLGGSLRLRLDSLLRCTIVVEKLTDERVVIINGELIEIDLLFDHDIDDEDIKSIQVHLSVFFSSAMFDLTGYGLIIQHIGDEVGQCQKI